MCAKVENGVTNRAKIFAGKTGKTQFWPKLFQLFEQDRLLFARVEIGVTECPTKIAKKSENFFVCLNFLAAEKLTFFWGGG